MSALTQLLIFDLDGTLIDSKRDIVLCVNRAFERQGLPPMDEQRVGDQIGRGSEYLYRQLLGSEYPHSGIEILVKRFKSLYARHLLDHTHVYAGVQEALEHFKDTPKVIVTNKNQEFADLLVTELGLRPHFQAVFGSEAFATQKPDGGPLRETCARWKVDPSQAVIVGDSEFDILAGKSASVRTVAAMYGFTKREVLRGHSPDHEIESARDLISLLAI